MQALERILAILESVSRYPNGVLPTRVAEECGLSLSTIVRLMQSLQDEEVLIRTGTAGEYRVGPRLIGVVGRATRSFDVRAAAVPILEQLRDRSGGETASLHVREGLQRVCAAAAYTTHHSGRIVPLGLALPLPGSSVGHLLLSQLPDQEYAEAMATLGLSTSDQKRVESQIEQVRTQGYSESVNDSVEGVRGVAVPIGTAGALSVSGPSERFTQEMVPDVLVHLRHAAELFEQSGLRLEALRAN